MVATSYRDIRPIEYNDKKWIYKDTKRKVKMSCKCQGCGNRYKVDLIIPDDLWEKIKPKEKPKGAGLLCGSCIMKKIEAFDKYDVWQLKTNLGR
uniref:Uncharacterized protein n=1 Tax=viral metagenome TaxID=1070528 RepID=A0A6M3K851_9ZZZZ